MHAAVAQLEERPVENRKVVGSIPAGGTTDAPFGYGLVFRSFTAGEWVRVPYGVRRKHRSGSSAGLERRPDKAEAGGSNPPRTTNNLWTVKLSLVRAPACRAGGRGFKSRHGRCRTTARSPWREAVRGELAQLEERPLRTREARGFESPILHHDKARP